MKKNLAFLTLVVALALVPDAARAQCPNNSPAHTKGTWTILPFQMPINPISATLLHTNHILLIAGSENDKANHDTGTAAYRNALWDLAGTDQSAIEVYDVDYDVFCSGSAVLRDGRSLVVGGTSDYSFTGERRASIYDPATEGFMQSQNMADGRWYGTATALGDGRIMAFSGLSSTGGTNNTVEIYDLAAAGAHWSTPAGASFTPPLFPREFLLPSGKVFFTGQGSGSRTSRSFLFDPGPKTWANSATLSIDRTYGGCVLFPLLPPSYIPTVGCFGGGSPPTNSIDVIDLSAPTPAWSNISSPPPPAGPGPTMSATRIELNSILLPDGTVLLSGGSGSNEVPDAGGKRTDLFNTAVYGVREVATASYSRLYHSTALLLPDATVASMGSNPGDRGKYLGAIEIFTPPYLFDASDHLITTGRPVINSVPATPIGYGAGFSVTYTAGSSIKSAVLMRPGSTTHAFDMEQRMVGLCGPSPQPACGPGSGTLNLTAPSNGNLAPPGFYMLFLFDNNGVPSVAQWIQLTAIASAPPDGTITSPASDPTITAGGSVSFGTTTTASKYSWIFPGGTPAVSTAKNPGNVTWSSAGEYLVSLSVIDASGNSDPSPSTRVVTVNPTSPDFEIKVGPPSLVVHPGNSTFYDVTVTPKAGFTGTVSLSVTSEGGFPAGVTSGGFSPPTISGGSGSSVLTMNASNSTVPYAVTMTVKGTSGSLSRTSSTTLLVNLDIPQSVQANPSDSQVALSWLPSTGASSYRVARAQDENGPYENVGCPSGTSYTDSGLTNGTTYYYEVSGVFVGGPNAGGASAPSADVPATPACPIPSYSGSVSASRSAGVTTWSWTAGGATKWDLMRGDLNVLRSTGGDFTAALAAIPAAEAVCLANDTALLSLTDSSPDPPEDGGFFMVLRPSATTCPAHGTCDDASSSLVGSRDPGIEASSRSCP